MRRESGLPPSYTARAEALQKNIHKHFYLPEYGRYRYILTPFEDMPGRQEGLGHAFALLFGVVPENLQKKLVKNIFRTPFGINVQPNALSISPALPEGCREILLEGIVYCGMTLNIHISRGDNCGDIKIPLRPGSTENIDCTTGMMI